MPNRSNFVIYPGAVAKILKSDPRADALVRGKANEVVAFAKVDFERQQRHDNESRTSEFTPPKYIESFGVRRIESDHGVKYEAFNDDPGATLVEYGAHAGGEHFVLRYKPLTHGLNAITEA